MARPAEILKAELEAIPQIEVDVSRRIEGELGREGDDPLVVAAPSSNAVIWNAPPVVTTNSTRRVSIN